MQGDNERMFSELDFEDYVWGYRCCMDSRAETSDCACVRFWIDSTVVLLRMEISPLPIVTDKLPGVRFRSWC